MTTDQANQSYWKRCSSCKSEIEFSTPYWVCSVSTCNRKRTGMMFCSVSCWEMHRPMMRHRDDYAIEKRSPSRDEWLREQAQESAAEQSSGGSAATGSSRPGASSDAGVVRRRVPVPAATSSAGEPRLADGDEIEREVLVVASKLKKYVRARSGMSTSDGVMSVLSDHLRAICDQAIRSAAQDGRKTVLDRDIPRPPSRSS